MDKIHAINSDALSRPNDYTGIWQSFWPNGQLRYRGEFANGVEVGQHVCYWKNGVLAHVHWCDSNGCVRGTTVNFYADGAKESEETWNDDNRRPGTFVERCFDANGDVFLRCVYREYEQVELWRRPGDRDPESEAAIDNIVAEALRELEASLDGEGEVQDDDEELEDKGPEQGADGKAAMGE